MSKKGLKISNETSTIQKVDSEARQRFENSADEAFARIQSFGIRVKDLSVKYKSFIEDKTLSVNKSPIAKDFEKEIIDKLITLASELNTDETQPEGVGSNALSALLLRCLLMQRDRINDLEFKLEQFIKSEFKKTDA